MRNIDAFILENLYAVAYCEDVILGDYEGLCCPHCDASTEDICDPLIHKFECLKLRTQAYLALHGYTYEELESMFKKK